MAVGHMIQDGPNSIHEKGSVGIRYLTPAISLYWHCNMLAKFKACQIYCDASGDEESGYFPPLARLAEWDRSTDMQTFDIAWPNVSVELFQLDPDSGKR